MLILRKQAEHRNGNYQASSNTMINEMDEGIYFTNPEALKFQSVAWFNAEISDEDFALEVEHGLVMAHLK